MKDFLKEHSDKIQKISCLGIGLLGIALGKYFDVDILTNFSAIFLAVTVGVLGIHWFEKKFFTNKKEHRHR